MALIEIGTVTVASIIGFLRSEKPLNKGFVFIAWAVSLALMGGLAP